MEQAPQEFQDLAYRILANEAGGNHDPLALLDGGAAAFHKLYERLAALVGSAGFRALFSRALQMATADFPFLKVIQPEPLGDLLLEGMRERILEQGVDQPVASDGVAALLANVIWLLNLFIGKDITLRQIGSIWPNLRHDENPPGTEEVEQ